MGMFKNLIAIWRGAIIDIPANWQLCDGSNGTPDLRDKFIIGSQKTYEVGDTGGNANHTHGFTTDGHKHSFKEGTQINSGFIINIESATTICTGTTDAANNAPPYYSLAFMMRMT